MVFPKSISDSLNYSLFQRPTSEYRGLPFWSWNCRLDKETVDEQLKIFKEMGFGGVVIHPRDGLDTEYLGAEFMEIVHHTVERCRKMGLICWLYDDDRFPSGAADGLVTKNPRYRARQLRLTAERLNDDYCASQAEFNAEIDKGRIPRGYYLTAYTIRIEDKHLAEYRRLTTDAEIEAAINSGKNVRYAYLELQEEHEFFQGYTYSDTMNPEAVDEFIKVTHEQYKAALGDDFGKAASAIFTDEPRIGMQQPITSAESKEDVYVPYTEYFADWSHDKYGIDVLNIVPEFIWDRADGDRHNRYLYHEAAAECFSSVFLDRICEWCKKNNILMTGHILGESPLGAQSTTAGEAMRCYRNMDIPGIDILIDGREFTSAKQAASVAAQYGREAVMSELYGVTNWDCTFKTYKLQGDWQAALGITVRIPHLSHMSLKGEAKRDWPGSIFYQAPWYKEFPYIENHFARLNTVLTRGKRITKVAVVNPVESLWVQYGSDDLTNAERKKLDTDFVEFAKWLLCSTIDFDYLSESLLPNQCVSCNEKMIHVGDCTYEAIILPEIATIRETTLDILESFIKNGGTVILAGNPPKLVNGAPSNRAAEFSKKCICIPNNKEALIKSLKPFRDIEIDSDNLLYQLREDDDCRWLFICHANRTYGESEKHTIKINGNYSLVVYDTLCGERFNMASHIEDGCTSFEWICCGEDSILLRLDKSYSDFAEYAVREYKTVQTIDKISSFKRNETNVLLLDYARFSVDGGEIQAKEEILRADNKVRKMLGFTLRTGTDRQPYTTPAGETHSVTLYYDINSEIAAPVKLGIEDPEACRVYINGEAADMTVAGWYVDKAISAIKLPDIKKGANELKVEIKYNQKSYLENIYLLGDFDIQLKDGEAVITSPRDTLNFGDITTQGMPFYTGNLHYVFEVEISTGGEYFIRIPKFNAPALAVYADGKECGLIAYSPHRLSLGRLDAGRHEIEVVMYGNRFNSFGMLHNANENYTWYGNGSYRTTGDDWTDDYMLRPVGVMEEIKIESLC